MELADLADFALGFINPADLPGSALRRRMPLGRRVLGLEPMATLPTKKEISDRIWFLRC